MYTNPLSQTKLGFALSTFTFSLALSTGAAAQQQCGDTTCDVGFECKTYVGGCPQILIACAEGDDCNEAPPCEPQEQPYCDRASCETDADCGDIMVCETFTEFCGAGVPDCAEGEECDVAVEPVECEGAEYTQCTAPWELECDVDADCGEGFACTAEEICPCAGSAGSAASSGDAAPEGVATDRAAPSEPSDLDEGGCSCGPSDRKSCIPRDIECGTDADCPTNWTCVESALDLCIVDDEGNCGGDAGETKCQPPYDKVYDTTTIASVELAATSGVAGDDLAAASGPAGGTQAPAQAMAGTAERNESGESIARDTDANGSSTAASGGCSVVTGTGSGGSLPWASVMALAMLLGFRRSPRRS